MKPRILLSAKKNMQFYVDAVEACGAIADARYLPRVNADDYDALIICGGVDSHPKYYGEEICGAVDIDLDRDECEFALADEFIKAGKPVMGICRGCQLLNIYFGGNLVQNIETAADHKGEDDLVHDVVAFGDGDSIAMRLYGKAFSVNSAHHQAIKELGRGLRVTLKSKNDGIVEAIEHESLPVIGFQFHPERMCQSQLREDTVDGIEIFKYFIGVCRND